MRKPKMFKKISALIKEGKSNDNDVKNVGDETPVEEMEVKGDMMGEAKEQQKEDEDYGEMWKDPAFEAPEVGYNEEKNLSIAKSMKSDSYDEWQPKDDPWSYSAKFGEGDKVEDVVFYATSPEGKRVKVTADSNAEAFEAIAKTNPEIMAMMEEEKAAADEGPQGPAPGDIPDYTPPADKMMASAPIEPEGLQDALDNVTPPSGPAADMDPMSQITQAVAGKSPEEVKAWVTENADLAGSYLQGMAKIAKSISGAQ